MTQPDGGSAIIKKDTYYYFKSVIDKTKDSTTCDTLIYCFKSKVFSKPLT